MAPNYCTSVAADSAYLEQLHVLQEAAEVLREMIAFCFPIRSGGALPQPAWGSLTTATVKAQHCSQHSDKLGLWSW